MFNTFIFIFNKLKKMKGTSCKKYEIKSTKKQNEDIEVRQKAKIKFKKWYIIIKYMNSNNYFMINILNVCAKFVLFHFGESNVSILLF